MNLDSDLLMLADTSFCKSHFAKQHEIIRAWPVTRLKSGRAATLGFPRAAMTSGRVCCGASPGLGTGALQDGNGTHCPNCCSAHLASRAMARPRFAWPRDRRQTTGNRRKQPAGGPTIGWLPTGQRCGAANGVKFRWRSQMFDDSCHSNDATALDLQSLMREIRSFSVARGLVL